MHLNLAIAVPLHGHRQLSNKKQGLLPVEVEVAHVAAAGSHLHEGEHGGMQDLGEQ